MVFPVVNSTLEKIFNGYTLEPVHSVGLTGASLAIRKDSNDPLIEDKIEDRLHLVEVQLLVRLIGLERVVKFELCVIDELSHAIHLVPAVVDDDLGVRHRNHVNFSVGQLVVENGSFLEADTDFHLICENVLAAGLHLLHFSFDHGLEVDVDLDAIELVVGLSFAFQLPGLLHSESSGVAVYFNLINLVGSSDLSLNWLVFNDADLIWVCSRFALWADAILFFKPIFPLLGGSVGWQSFVL